MATTAGDPDQIKQFCEISQAERDVAIRLLNSADWNLERALQLHFEGIHLRLIGYQKKCY